MNSVIGKRIWEYNFSSTEEVFLVLSAAVKNLDAVKRLNEKLAKSIAVIYSIIEEALKEGNAASLSSTDHAVLSLLDLETIRKFVIQEKNNNTHGIAKMSEIIHYQLSLVGVAIGLVPFNTRFYTLKELPKIFFGEKQWEELVRLIATLREFANNESSWPLAKLLLSRLESTKNFGNNEYNFGELLILILIIHTIYKNFYKFSDDLQITCLRSYFYSAIILGLPIRNILSDQLFETRTPLKLVSSSKFFVDAIKNSSESVPVVERGKIIERPLKLLINEYVQHAGDNAHVQLKQETYIRQLYGDKKEFIKYAEWLKEAFAIYFDLLSGVMIKNNIGGILTEEQIYVNDMIRLLSLFGIGKPGMNDIINYFNKDNPVVSLKAFLREISMVTNLDNTIAIDNCLVFEDAAKKEGLLPSNQDLLYFSESEGKFCWSLRSQ